MKGGIFKMVRKVSFKKKKKEIVNAPDENCFWVSDGKVLRNLYDLERALNEISPETYSYHVNSQKNDFAVWVKEILKEPKLSDSLKKAKSKEEALKKVRDRLKQS